MDDLPAEGQPATGDPDELETQMAEKTIQQAHVNGGELVPFRTDNNYWAVELNAA